MKILTLSLLLALAACSGGHPAYAHQVYPGCAAPTSTGKVWYVDPANGKTPAAGGLGTQAAPWNSLQGVVGGLWSASLTVPGYSRPLLSTIPYNHVTPAGRVDAADDLGAPPVHPGDTILLMSGSYGDISIGAYQTEIVNSDWVQIKAAPGQVPVFTTLSIGSTNKWLFNGVKVQSPATPTSTRALVIVADSGPALPTRDIILENLSVSSVDDGTGATQAQWLAQGRSGVWLTGSAGDGTNGEPSQTCISVTGSHIYNVRYGAAVFANQTLFSGNEIDHFGDDGIEFGANNIAITRNRVHDSFDVGDGNHEDGMQGVIGPIARGVPFNRFSNVLIDSNEVIRSLDASIPFPTYLQGIDAFDSDWTNMRVTNNVIITASCYSITLASVHDSLVAGNTGLEDGLFATPGCTASMIIGGKTHEGLDSSNVRIANNLAEHYLIDTRNNETVSFDHNVALNAYQPFVTWTGTAWSYAYPIGTDAQGNVAPKVSVPYASVFQTWDPANRNYDLMLKVNPGATTPIAAGAHGYPPN